MIEKAMKFIAVFAMGLGMVTAGTPTLAQDDDPNPPAIVFQNGYNFNWLVGQDKTDHFEEFVDQAFYGAFVANDDGDSYWYSGFHNLETARTATLAWCARDKSTGSSDCELIAYLIPKNVGADFVSGLSNTAIEEYNEYLTYGTYRAFALSANGAYAYAWDHLSQSDANAAAIEICDESAESKSEWEIGQSYSCALFNENNEVPLSKPKPAPRIKK